MKHSRFLSLALALVLMVSLASVTASRARAVDTYDIWIADVQIDSTNQKDVLGDGTVSYDPNTKTLTLKDAKIENLKEDGDGIRFEEDLTITGTGSIKAEDIGVDAWGKLTIRDAKLTIDVRDYDAISTVDDLMLQNCDLTLSSDTYCGIYLDDYDGKEPCPVTVIADSKIVAKSAADNAIETYDLTIRNSEITAEGDTNGIYAHGGAFVIEDSVVSAQGGGSGIAADDSDLTIRGEKTVIKAKGKEFGIIGEGGKLSIADGAKSVTADAEERFAIGFENGIELGSKLAIKEPAGGKLDPQKQIIMEADGKTRAMHAVIGRTELYISYDAAGGSGKMDRATVKEGAEYTLPECRFTAPDGKQFDQWDAGKPGDRIKPTDDMTLTAVWKDKPLENPFTDVPKGEYYFDPVLWALNHKPQITDGMTETTFVPDGTCTRGQVVTFLWRAMGCAEPNKSDNPFSDVTKDDYFYKAVLWAVEKGVTDGTSDTTFSPNDPCTRAHVVTFLWRSENKPEAGKDNPFQDVAEGEYYYSPVLWSVEQKITDGTTETTFSPDAPCTRGQIVTFLYRDMK